MPDGAAVDIYLEMWDGVFTFVPRMVSYSQVVKPILSKYSIVNCYCTVC